MAKGDREGWDPRPNERLQSYLSTHPRAQGELTRFFGTGLGGLEVSKLDGRRCDVELLQLYADVIGEEIRRDSASAPIQRARLKRVAESLADQGADLKPNLKQYL